MVHSRHLASLISLGTRTLHPAPQLTQGVHTLLLHAVVVAFVAVAVAVEILMSHLLQRLQTAMLFQSQHVVVAAVVVFLAAAALDDTCVM